MHRAFTVLLAGEATFQNKVISKAIEPQQLKRHGTTETSRATWTIPKNDPLLFVYGSFVNMVFEEKQKQHQVCHNLVSQCSVFVYFNSMRVVRKSQATSITSPIRRKKRRSRDVGYGVTDIMVTPNYTPFSERQNVSSNVPMSLHALSKSASSIIYEHQSLLEMCLVSILCVYSPCKGQTMVNLGK